MGKKDTSIKWGTKATFQQQQFLNWKKENHRCFRYDAANFSGVTVEKLDGKDYNVLTSGKGKFYFDVATGLLYKSNTEMGDAVIKSYLTVDGIKFPGDIEAEGNGQKVVIKTTKVTINSGVTDADFK